MANVRGCRTTFETATSEQHPYEFTVCRNSSSGIGHLPATNHNLTPRNNFTFVVRFTCSLNTFNSLQYFSQDKQVRKRYPTLDDVSQASHVLLFYIREHYESLSDSKLHPSQYPQDVAVRLITACTHKKSNSLFHCLAV